MPDIQITGVHYEVADRVRAYIVEKLGALKKYHPGLHKIHVTIHQAEKVGYRVDVEMHLPHGKDIIAHDSEQTVYAAVDVVADKCAAQLRRLHDKHAHHGMRHGERAIA